MSGLGLIKLGRKASLQNTSIDMSNIGQSYRSGVTYDAIEGATATDSKDGGDDDVGFEIVEDDTVTSAATNQLASVAESVQISLNEDLLPAYDRIKKAMKLLKYACKEGSTTDAIMEAIAAVQRLANSTYAIRVQLGERGACEALTMLLEKNKEDADIVLEIIKAMSFMLLTDDENKVRLAKCGGCRLTIKAMKIHCEDPGVLEQCCKLMVDFGNGKFAAMLEAEYSRKEEERERRSRNQKRAVLTPSRIAKMTPSAAAAATKAMEELKITENLEREGESDAKSVGSASVSITGSDFKADSKTGPSAGNSVTSATAAATAATSTAATVTAEVKQSAIWDNRLELCNVGACGVLSDILHNLVKMPTAIDSAVINLAPIFEDEDVVVAACNAIASMAANPVCCAKFACDGQISRYLCTLLMHTRHWNLMTAAAWAIVNLCLDNKSGNRDRMGAAGAGENLCKGLAEFSLRQKDFVQVTGFDRLLEYFVWALLNVVISNTLNQQRVRALQEDEMLQQLADSACTKDGVKDKLRQVLKLVANPDAVVNNINNSANATPLPAGSPVLLVVKSATSSPAAGGGRKHK